MALEYEHNKMESERKGDQINCLNNGRRKDEVNALSMWNSNWRERESICSENELYLPFIRIGLKQSIKYVLAVFRSHKARGEDYLFLELVKQRSSEPEL